MSQTNTRKVARPAQGTNSLPTKPGPWRVSLDAANATPSVRGSGTLSRPGKPPKWRPRGDKTPRVIQD